MFFAAVLLITFSGNSSAQTPTLVYDINSGMDPSSPSNFTVFNGKLYFAADDGLTGMELWVYDGVNNPSRVADINSGAGGSDPSALTVFNSKLYFTADSGISGKELWVYTGTGSPAMVTGTGNTILSLDPELIVYKDSLYYSAFSSSTGMELYKYTGSGTPSLVYDINSGANGSAPYSFCIYKDSLYFGADDGSTGAQLWRYSGSGTPSLVKRIGSSSFGAVPDYLTVMSNKLYFAADDGVRGTELWSWDDTDTAMVGEIASGSLGGMPEHLTVYNNVLYFAADDGVKGTEFWKYTGTGAPSLVADIYTGTFNASFPTDFVVYNDTLYFTAGEATHGAEPRKYGGGTGSSSVILVDDIQSGAFGSFASGYTKFGASLYFLADDGVKGGELWKMTATCSPILDTLTVTACDTFVFNGITYFSSNSSAKDTITASAGCDTIRTLNLTIKYSSFPLDSFVNVCDSFSLFGVTYYDSAIVDTVFMNSVGCDSIVTFFIGITKSSSKDSFITACDSIQLYGVTYTSSIVVDTVLTNSVGCDSLLTYHITINNSSTNTVNFTACDSYTWRGNTFTSSTTFDSTYTNAVGCDSTVTYNVTINHSFNRDTFVNLCGTSYTWRGTTYNNSTTASLKYKTVAGCDSTITLHLTLGKPTYSYHTETACYNYFWRGTTYYNSGVHSDTMVNSAGCDSILLLNLTINKATRADTFATSCGLFSWRNGLVRGAGVLVDTMVNSAGCDSIVTLHVTASHTAYNEINEVKCDSVNVNGTWYKDEGTYHQTLTSAAGCDSILTINYAKHFGRDTTTIIQADKYILNGTTYTSSGMYNIGIIGCDTTVLDLTIYEKDSVFIYDTLCRTKYGDYEEGFYYYHYYDDALQNYYTDYIDLAEGISVPLDNSSGPFRRYINVATKSGFDSVLVIDFIVAPAFILKDTVVCDVITLDGRVYDSADYEYEAHSYKYGSTRYRVPSYQRHTGWNCYLGTFYKVKYNRSVTTNKNIMSCHPVVVGGHTFTQTGKYTINLSTDKGCDSTIKLDYTFLNKSTIINKDTCDRYELNGITYTNSGTYKQPVKGCNQDTITLNLTVRHRSTPINDTITACNKYIWQDSTYTESTNDTRIYTNAVGCDSVRNLVLTINKPQIIVDSIEACMYFNWHGKKLTNAGTYSDTFVNIHGCDSIRVLALDIKDRDYFGLTPLDTIDVGEYHKFGASVHAAIAISNNGKYLILLDEAAIFSVSGIYIHVYEWDGAHWVKIHNNSPSLSYKTHSNQIVVWEGTNTVAVSDDGKTAAMSFEIGANGKQKKRIIKVFSLVDSKYVSKGDSLFDIVGTEFYGRSIELSADGNTIAIGVPRDQLSGTYDKSHAAVYTFNGTAWVKKGSNMGASFDGRGKGYTIDLSPDGNRIAVAGTTTGNVFGKIQGDVIVYDWDGTSWKTFGNPIKNVLENQFDTGSHGMLVAFGPDSNIVAVTAKGSKVVEVYKNNPSNFTWEVRDTIKLAQPLYQGAKIYMIYDGNIIGVGNYNNAAFFKFNGTKYEPIVENYYNLFGDFVTRQSVAGGAGFVVARDTPRIVHLGDADAPYNSEKYYVGFYTSDLCDAGDFVGIDDPEYSITAQGVNFVVYPNPSNGVFTLRVDVPNDVKGNLMEYEVYNLQGVVVSRGTMNGAEGEISIAGQPAGMYFVKFYIAGYTGTAKMLIEN